MLNIFSVDEIRNTRGMKTRYCVKEIYFSAMTLTLVHPIFITGFPLFRWRTKPVPCLARWVLGSQQLPLEFRPEIGQVNR